MTMTRRFLTPAIVITAIAIGATALTAHATSAITRPRLERDLPVVFSNLYVKQAAILGRTGITVESLHAGAMCDKHGPKVPDIGPGGDWTCLMSWNDPHVKLPDGWGKFDLNVHSNGCYMATGPTKLTGFLTISDTSGRDVTNPLFEFDSCFDLHSSNAPTGVVFPSALTVTSTAVGSGPSGTPTVDVSCSLGEKGCAGRVIAQSAAGPEATAAYDLEPGRKITLSLPGLSAGPISLAFAPRTGTAPTPTQLPMP
jgi:hypothetical protein